MAADNEDIEAMRQQLSMRTAKAKWLRQTINELLLDFNSRIEGMLRLPEEERNVAAQIEVERAAEAENDLDENVPGDEEETPEMTRAALRDSLERINSEIKALEQRKIDVERIAVLARDNHRDIQRFLDTFPPNAGDTFPPNAGGEAFEEDIEAMRQQLSRRTAEVEVLRQTVNELEHYYELARDFSSRIQFIIIETIGNSKRNVAAQIEVEWAAEAENDENVPGDEEETPEITRAVLQGLLDEKNSEFKALKQRKIEVEPIAVLAKDFHFDLKRFFGSAGGGAEERDQIEAAIEAEQSVEQNEPLPNDENP